MSTEGFLLTATNRVRVGLRRYTNELPCPADATSYSHHRALVITGESIGEFDNEGYLRADRGPETPHDDPRWPRICTECGYEFTDADVWQDWRETLWDDSRDGGTITLREAPPGAMYDAHWLPWKGVDGKSMMAVLPDGHPWAIDSVANNCTIHTGQTRTILPYDPDPSSAPEAHRCWIRHGEPPRITVDKAGHTCAAGAGSIQSGNYHGFLRDGVFT